MAYLKNDAAPRTAPTCLPACAFESRLLVCFVLVMTFPFVIEAPAELEAIKSCLSATGEAEPFSEWLLKLHDDG